MDRLALFLFVCIASRLAIAYGIQRCPHRYLPVVAVPAFIVSVGLLVAFFQKKMVGGFGGTAWWHPYRPVHATAYLCLGVLLALRLREKCRQSHGVLLQSQEAWRREFVLASIHARVSCKDARKDTSKW